ncbi:tRNA pseudouridine(38-40) synthase TruA [Bacteroidales bacterium OttesenSCG-928-J19]|nr:tRNA pseudouridine(38-40) synthase TruA [Bacteroidales bacterium OttesenSCG-928-J19]
MARYFIYLAYDGKNYCGWQVQPNGITVQEELERGLGLLLRKPTPVTGAGRTDSGVHAARMAAHFDWEGEPFEKEVLAGKLNKVLPPDIAVDRIVSVREEAHARFDALSRTYKYFITDKKDPFLRENTYYIPRQLDYKRMNEAAQTLFDYIDFTSFSKLHTDVKTNNCRIMHAQWVREGERWVFTIQADRFLRNMVRAIVGTLLEVGRGKLSVEGFREIILSQDRGKAGTSAPAHALFLWDIDYPEDLFT